MYQQAKQNKQKILVVDDHELVLSKTIELLKQQYSEAEILKAQTKQEVLNQVGSITPDLIVVDLAIPENRGGTAQVDIGIQLLETLMREHPTLNIVVQSAYPRPLVRLKNAISLHKGGFTVADKSLPMNEMLTKVDWAIQGVIYTPKEMRSGLEVRPEWLEVLQLAFKEGLQDATIADRMNVSQGLIKHYWRKIRDELGVYPDEGTNLRIQTEIRAREEGLID